MAKYRRRHSGPNLSDGMIWLMGICGLAYIIYKVVSCNQVIRDAVEYEMKEKKGDETRDTFTNPSKKLILPEHISN
jgi:hypothetical protein